MTMTPTNVKPYETEAEYMDHEFAWVKAHVAVLDAEKRLSEAIRSEDPSGRVVGKMVRVTVTEHERRLADLRAEEAAIRADIDARLAVHRKEGSFKLGLDILCAASSLSDDERRIVLFLLLPAVSPQIATDVYADFGYYGAFQAGELVQLMRSETVADWLRYRRFFHISAPLVRKKVVVMDWPSKIAHPGDLLSATVTLTPQAFAIAVGEPDLVVEGLPTDTDGKTTN